MATETEVRAGALRMLGILDVGDTAGATDDIYMTQKYAETYAMLKEKGLAYWASGSTVPDKFSPHVQALLAFFSTEDYSISGERLQRINAKASIAFREIKSLGKPEHESTDNPTDF
jgi:hypothetical protein